MGAILNFSSHSLPVTGQYIANFCINKFELSPYFYGINFGSLPECFYPCNGPVKFSAGPLPRISPTAARWQNHRLSGTPVTACPITSRRRKSVDMD
jgi:hypothetical protein